LYSSIINFGNQPFNNMFSEHFDMEISVLCNRMVSRSGYVEHSGLWDAAEGVAYLLGRRKLYSVFW
jgi:hypothetical protein